MHVMFRLYCATAAACSLGALPLAMLLSRYNESFFVRGSSRESIHRLLLKYDRGMGRLHHDSAAEAINNYDRRQAAFFNDSSELMKTCVMIFP